MRTYIYFWAGLMVFLVGAACGEKLDPLYDMEDETETGYRDTIKPILVSHCIRCHGTDVTGTDRNGAPEDVNLDSYGGAGTSGARADAEIQADEMPPDAPPLTPADKDSFQQWVDDGMPE
jgi:mono/diheme cytochrome c family protein